MTIVSFPTNPGATRMARPLTRIRIAALAATATLAFAAAEKPKPTFDDVVILTAGSTIHCTVKSAADRKITLLVNDGAKGTELTLPLDAVERIETKAERSVRFVPGAPLKKDDVVFFDNDDVTIKKAPLQSGAKEAVRMAGDEFPAVNILKLKAPENHAVDLSDQKQTLEFKISLSGQEGNKRGFKMEPGVNYTSVGERKDLANPDSIPLWAFVGELSYAYDITHKPPPKTGESPFKTYRGEAKLDYETNNVRRHPTIPKLFGWDFYSLAYTRADVGFDRVKHIRQFNEGAIGLGFISGQNGFRLRLGAGYRNEDYNDPQDPTKSSVGSLGIDLGVTFTRKFHDVELKNDFKTVGSAATNFHWKDKLSLQFGKKDTRFSFGPAVEWDYLSRPTATTRKLDTTYTTEGGFKW